MANDLYVDLFDPLAYSGVVDLATLYRGVRESDHGLY